jgi:P-type Ca2+ transporter type 2C
VFNEISSREMEKINVFKGILDNYVFVAVISSTVILQYIIVQFLGEFANTIPLSYSQWFACILLGFLRMPIAALVKLIPVSSAKNAAPQRPNQDRSSIFLRIRLI